MNCKKIIIAGNIGVGKTSLTQLLSDRFKIQAIYEQFEENPYLANFYKDMKNWAFHSQIFFLSQRLEQFNTVLNNCESYILDRCIYEDGEVFAKNLFDQGMLNTADWRVYHDLYSNIGSLMEKPDLLLYLAAPTELLSERVKQRAREGENAIGQDYLEQLNNLYNEWYHGFNHCKKIKVDMEGIDFVKNEDQLNNIAVIIENS